MHKKDDGSSRRELTVQKQDARRNEDGSTRQELTVQKPDMPRKDDGSSRQELMVQKQDTLYRSKILLLSDFRLPTGHSQDK